VLVVQDGELLDPEPALVVEATPTL